MFRRLLFFGSYFRVWHKKTRCLGVRVFKSRRSENLRVAALSGLAQSCVFLGEAFAPPMCAELKKTEINEKNIQAASDEYAPNMKNK